MLVILYLRFSRPRADDEEGDAEDSCKKGGRLMQLLPLHQELLLFVTFCFPQVASRFLTCLFSFCFSHQTFQMHVDTTLYL